MNRAEILQTAQQCVCTDREQQYGKPEDNFQTIAELWSVYYSRVLGLAVTFTAHDVGIMMSLLKAGRIASGQVKADNYVDAAGYLACAGEIATRGVTPCP